jgi:hypothetical protein
METIIAILAVIAAAFGLGQWRGGAAERSRQAKRDLNAVRETRKVEQDVDAMDDPERRAAGDEWMRGRR